MLVENTRAFALRLHPEADEDAVVYALGLQGWQFLWSTQDEQGFVSLQVQRTAESEGEDAFSLPGVLEVQEFELPEIDWEAQWQAFAPGYSDGFVHLPVGTTEMCLKAGPGFGDASHPTTQLMLEALAERVEGKHILDIGTGSGILAIAARLLGAQSVLGTDIDLLALEHASQNLELNPQVDEVRFQDARSDITYAGYDLVLLNMIRSEQEVVWQSLSFVPQRILASGMRIEELSDWERTWRQRGYQKGLSEVREGWVLVELHKKREA